MFESVLSFIDRHQSFILTTHDFPDADGLGAELVLASILKFKGKNYRIINSCDVPANLRFIECPDLDLPAADNNIDFEKYDKDKHLELFEDSAVMILDTSDFQYLGCIREALKIAGEIYYFDHHETRPHTKLKGFVDNTASSTSELAVELACSIKADLDPKTATAAYAGIVFDSGFFAYPKTSVRTFKAAIKTLEWGAQPNYIYRQLMENSSFTSILLLKQALINMEFFANKKIAVIVLLRNDFKITGAEYEESESIVNMPLKTKEVEVSLLIKEDPQGNIRCSLRSKGMVNVSKIARSFGGGGHVTAAGFRSSLNAEETLKELLVSVENQLAAD